MRYFRKIGCPETEITLLRRYCSTNIRITISLVFKILLQRKKENNRGQNTNKARGTYNTFYAYDHISFYFYAFLDIKLCIHVQDMKMTSMKRLPVLSPKKLEGKRAARSNKFLNPLWNLRTT